MMDKFADYLSVLLLVNVLMITGCAKNCRETAVAQPVSALETVEIQTISNEQPQSQLLEEKWGIKVESARLSAGGYMIDFRYRVLDAAKAAPILDRSIKPYMVDQVSGAVFAVPTPPKVGQLRSGKNIQEGKSYFIIFANPAHYVKAGNEITVVIGDCEIRDIVVQ